MLHRQRPRRNKLTIVALLTKLAFIIGNIISLLFLNLDAPCIHLHSQAASQSEGPVPFSKLAELLKAREQAELEESVRLAEEEEVARVAEEEEALRQAEIREAR